MAIADHRRAAALLQAGGERAGFVRFDAASVEGSITARFRAQAERHPSRVAIKTDHGETTYSALARSVGRIAAVAAMRGRGNVALLCQPGAGAIAAMLGVLNAGRAYVPLEPSFPRVRLQQILDDVEADLLITDRANHAGAMALRQRGVTVLALDEIDSGAHDSYAAEVSPDAMAYVLYTSGSTGRPKGVAQSHRNLLHFIRSYTNSLRIGPDDRLSLVCPLSFSAALMDIYGSTLNGATVCPYDVQQRGSEGLADWIDRQGITVFHSVPTLFRQLTLALDGDRRLATVRAIDLGGETVYARDVALYRAHFSPDCVLINHLACSEASVLAQLYIDHRCDVGWGRIPAGPVADGISVHVVGADGEALPPGEIGELVVDSTYVSPGSWREWASSATGAGARTRRLRTGDLARVGADGMLDHLGRGGSRVKVRGHSIEPAEIERALLDIDGVREAVVVDRVARGGESDGVMLVAYVTSRDGRAISVETLRHGMATQLPEFMVPSLFIHLESMPLTTSGKIDRRALPPCTGQRPALEQAFVEPTDDLQGHLATIWSEMLGLDRVGIDDDFFALGGDSFLAVQLMVRIEAELGRSIPPMSLVTRRTVRRLAARIAAGDDARGGEWECVHDGGTGPPLFCLPGIGGTGFGFGDVCAVAAPPCTGFALHYPGVYGGERPLRRVEDLADRALVGLRSIQEQGPYFLCGYSFGGLVAYEMGCRLRAQGEDVAFLALLDTRGPAFRPRPVAQRLLVHARRIRATSDKLGYLRERVVSAWRRHARHPDLTGSKNFDALRSTPAVDAVSVACVDAARAYRPGPYPGRVTVLRSPEPGLEFWEVDPQFGWGVIARGGVDVYDIPARHDDIFRPEHVAGVAQRLGAALAATVDQQPQMNTDEHR